MGILKSCPRVPRTSERLGEMFKGGSADTYAGKFLLVSMGGQADTSNMGRGGARTPIGASGNFCQIYQNVAQQGTARTFNFVIIKNFNWFGGQKRKTI